MQNQDLVQTYLGLKQPSNTRNFNHIAHKQFTNYQSPPSSPRDENQLNGYNHLSGSERVIQKILGYPVTQVIVDEQENIILDIGDLITYKAVERAIKAKVLKNLLDAVYITK